MDRPTSGPYTSGFLIKLAPLLRRAIRTDEEHHGFPVLALNTRRTHWSIRLRRSERLGHCGRFRGACGRTGSNGRARRGGALHPSAAIGAYTTAHHLLI